MRRRSGTQHYRAHKERARALVHERLIYWNQYYGFTYNRVAIRNQRSRWGSCSQKQNLNFNYKLVFLPIELIDYVIVHELCHLKHFNHSQAFWNTVGETLGDYRKRKKQLHIATQNLRAYIETHERAGTYSPYRQTEGNHVL